MQGNAGRCKEMREYEGDGKKRLRNVKGMQKDVRKFNGKARRCGGLQGEPIKCGGKVETCRGLKENRYCKQSVA